MESIKQQAEEILKSHLNGLGLDALDSRQKVILAITEALSLSEQKGNYVGAEEIYTAKAFESLKSELDETKLLHQVANQSVDILSGENESLKKEIEQLKQDVNVRNNVINTSYKRVKSLEQSNKELLLTLHTINSIQEDEGKKGCRYGDTSYDSLSAVYGYNLCLKDVKDISMSAIQKHSEVK